MTATILYGHDAARRMLDQSKRQAEAWVARSGRAPCLALLSTGAASANAYARRIEEYAGIAGIRARLVDVAPDLPAGEALALLARLNDDTSVDGIVVMMPPPSGITIGQVSEALDPAKDVDGVTPVNGGRLARGLSGLFPCTPQAALALAEGTVGGLRGKRVTIVGASLSVGRPLAEMLLQRGATVTVSHVDTIDLSAACRTAELLFVAAGRPGLIDCSHVADGAVVIDIGINSVSDASGGYSVVGDVDLESVRSRARAVSAVPDGVGPLTAAFLIRNTLASLGCGPYLTSV